MLESHSGAYLFHSPNRVHIVDLRQLFLQVSNQGIQLANEPEEISTISHLGLVDGESCFTPVTKE